jgi:hypothetical protein
MHLMPMTKGCLNMFLFLKKEKLESNLFSRAIVSSWA